MSDLGLSLPLRIEEGPESVRVLDRASKVAIYVYVCAEPERRREMKRLSPEEGLAVAKVAARALEDLLTPDAQKAPPAEARGA